jgi:hypothetical protein
MGPYDNIDFALASPVGNATNDWLFSSGEPDEPLYEQQVVLAAFGNVSLA